MFVFKAIYVEEKRGKREKRTVILVIDDIKWVLASCRPVYMSTDVSVYLCMSAKSERDKCLSVCLCTCLSVFVYNLQNR